jgi:hypothetical protein
MAFAAVAGREKRVGTRGLQIALWIVAGLIALAAIGAGIYAFLHQDAFTAHQASVASPPAAEGDPTQIGHMILKAQFSGPLKDTVVQRWEDPATGNTCYIYLPVVVQHSPPTPTGFVQYGANGIGSISCLK